MLYVIEKKLFKTRTTERDTSKDKFPGGAIQTDIFTMSAKSDKRSAPLIRCFLDEVDDMENIDTLNTKVSSFLKLNSKGKEVIQVKLSRCGERSNINAAIIAIPFKGSIAGIVFGGNTTCLKGLIKNVDNFKHSDGQTYNKILYLIVREEGETTNDEADCITVYFDVVKRSRDGSTYSLSRVRTEIFKAFTKDPSVITTKIDEPVENLTVNELFEKAPKVSFVDMMDICKSAAVDKRN